MGHAHAKTTLGVVGFFLLATQLIVCGEQKTPQRQFKTYPLPGYVRSADISPNDRFVAVNVVERSTSKTGEVVDTSRVELRDFKANKAIATLTLGSAEPRRSPKTKLIIGTVPSAVVRYTPDGNSILAWFKSKLYVLQATDLKVIRTLDLPVPFVAANEESRPFLEQLETSDDGQGLVTVWSLGREHAVSSYEIPSGGQRSDWPFPAEHISGLVLAHDGLSAIFGIGDAFCSPQPTTTGVTALDLRSGSTELLVSTKAEPSFPAVLPGNKVAFTANSSCRQFHDKPDPELLVYSRQTNSLIYRGRTQEATGWILASPELNRMVAYSGDWKHHFDWGDFTGWYYGPGRESFTVWDSQTLQPIARSQNIPKLASCTVRVSRSGRYLVTSGWRRDGVYAVYELP